MVACKCYSTPMGYSGLKALFQKEEMIHGKVIEEKNIWIFLTLKLGFHVVKLLKLM